MALTPTGSNLTIQNLMVALGYSASAASTTGSGNVSLGDVVKRFCGTDESTPLHSTGSGIGLGHWGFDRMESPTINAIEGVTGTTGYAYAQEGDTGLIWARVNNCGNFWTASGYSKETIGGNGSYWTWVENTTGYGADDGDINMDLTGNYTSSFSAPDDGDDDGTDTFQAQYRCADLYNVDSENYDTLVSKTFQIFESGNDSGTGDGGDGGPGAGCLALGTEVLMADGSWKLIENIAINDEIKSVNFDDLPDGDRFGQYEMWYGHVDDRFNPMYLTHSTIVSNKIDYFYDHLKFTDETDSVLEVTETHPFLVYTMSGSGAEYINSHHIRFKRAKDITTDDKFVTADRTYVGIKSIENVIEEEQFAVFNAENVDTGIIKIGNNKFIVHNGKGD